METIKGKNKLKLAIQLASFYTDTDHFAIATDIYTDNGFTAHPYSLLYETYCIQHDSMKQTVDWHSCLVLKLYKDN